MRYRCGIGSNSALRADSREGDDVFRGDFGFGAGEERNLIGHSERVQREEENLRESLQNAFAGNREVYFKEELSALASAYEETIQSNMSVSLGLGATKWV